MIKLNLAQSTIGWRGFNFVQMNGPALYQKDIIAKQWKYLYEMFLKKSSSEESLCQFQPNLAQSIPGWREIRVFFSNKGLYLFPSVNNNEIMKKCGYSLIKVSF